MRPLANEALGFESEGYGGKGGVAMATTDYRWQLPGAACEGQIYL